MTSLRPIRHFFRVWGKSSDRRLALIGLPALLLFLSVGVAFPLLKEQHSNHADRYLHAAAIATQQKDWESASLYFERFLQQSPNHGLAAFHLAKVAIARGHLSQVHSLMAMLRELDDHRRHLWLAELLAETSMESEGIDQALHHIDLAEAKGLPTQAIRFRLAVSAYQKGEHERCLTFLDGLPLQAEQVLLQAQSLEQLGRREEARREAARLLSHLEHHPKGSRWLFEAQAERLLGNYARAESLLRPALDSPLAESIHPILTETYFHWLTDPAMALTLPEQCRLLERGLSLQADHPGLLRQFLRLTKPLSTQLLDGQLAHTTAPLLSHLSLGLSALAKGSTTRAAWHFDLARHHDATATAILRHCTTLANGESFPLSKALFAEVGIEEMP